MEKEKIRDGLYISAAFFGLRGLLRRKAARAPRGFACVSVLRRHPVSRRAEKVCRPVIDSARGLWYTIENKVSHR